MGIADPRHATGEAGGAIQSYLTLLRHPAVVYVAPSIPDTAGMLPDATIHTNRGRLQSNGGHA